ncbi:Pectinesterase inhibitor 10 [Linum perenne]
MKPRRIRSPGSPATAGCVEEVDNAVDSLMKSIGELHGAPRGGGPGFYRVIDDVETFVSAAETFDETCLDFFEEEARIGGGSLAEERGGGNGSRV